MLLDTRTPAYLQPRPVTFAALMELYEDNYLQLRRLCPEPPAAGAARVSRVNGALDLHLEVLERTRYTLTLRLTYRFGEGDGHVREQPDLRLRMFHDARQAEVLGRYCRRTGEDRMIDTLAGQPGLGCRWRHNRFLNKWLRYCLRQGHRFADAGGALSARAEDAGDAHPELPAQPGE
ncbi:DUF1249 domain-containing protein [Thioalkalivibrio sp. ALJ24]|uniref:DUF1249 domain-containing protein n=1 Tax=Thioalkalivibrio sp. ALJ24 TaxID=545276 RepID=UPI0003742DD9|nr:DUF1249 domain-containing protein [Thioalkalivibrio sp. ALJ24]